MGPARPRRDHPRRSTFAREGMSLYGRLLDVDDTQLHFKDDLKINLDTADDDHRYVFCEDRYRCTARVALCGRLGTCDAPAVARHYRADYAWIDVPIFDGRGYPSHERGVTTEPRLFFLGLPWRYTGGSGRFSGVTRDAEYLAEAIDARHATTHHSKGTILNELALGS